MSDLSDQDRQMLTNVHEVFYKARLIDSPQLANLGLQFTQFMQRVTAAKEPMLQNKPKGPEVIPAKKDKP